MLPQFQPRGSEAPNSSVDTRMEEDSPAPVQTVTTQASVSAHDGEYTTLESLQEETNALINQNKSFADCYQYLVTTIEALENHLKVVQECLIKDTQDLKDQITTLTAQLEQQQSQQPAAATRTTPPSRPIAALPTLT